MAGIFPNGSRRCEVMSKTPTEVLKREFKYYLDHQAEMVAKYDGRVIVLKDRRVIGDYATEAEAVVATRKEHPMGTFLVQRVSQGTEAYTQKFRSRVREP